VKAKSSFGTASTYTGCSKKVALVTVANVSAIHINFIPPTYKSLKYQPTVFNMIKLPGCCVLNGTFSPHIKTAR